MSTTAPDISGEIPLMPGIVGGLATAAGQLSSGVMQVANPALTGSVADYTLGPWLSSVPRFRPIELRRVYIPIAALTVNTSGQPQVSTVSYVVAVKVRGSDRYVHRGQLAMTPLANLVNSMGNDALVDDLVNPIYIGFGDEAQVWYSVAFDHAVTSWNFYLGVQLIDASGNRQAAPGAVYFETAD